MTGPTQAHPVRVEYVVERSISSGRWIVESITPVPTPEQAEADAAWFMNDPRYGGTYRTVRRTITSTVVTVHPAPQQGDRS